MPSTNSPYGSKRVDPGLPLRLPTKGLQPVQTLCFSHGGCGEDSKPGCNFCGGGEHASRGFGFASPGIKVLNESAGYRGEESCPDLRCIVCFSHCLQYCRMPALMLITCCIAKTKIWSAQARAENLETTRPLHQEEF